MNEVRRIDATGKHVFIDGNGDVELSDDPFDVRKRFVAYFHFVGWDCISLGAHVCLSLPNFEIHLPFGFIRVGWMKCLYAEFGFVRRDRP